MARYFCDEGFEPWDSDANDFNPCFEDIALWSFPPLAWFLITGIVLWLDTRRYKPRYKSLTLPLQLIQWFGGIYGVMTFFLVLIRYANTDNLNGSPEGHEMFGAAMVMVSWVGTVYLLRHSLVRGFQVPKRIRFWFLIAAVSETIKFQTEAQNGNHYRNLIHVILYPVALGACFIALILPQTLPGGRTSKREGTDTSFVPLLEDEVEEEEVVQTKKNPEVYANFLSQISFWWLNPLLKNGNQRPLVNDDLFPPPHAYHSRNVSIKFEKAWQAEQKRPKPSLWRAFHYAFGPAFYWAALLKLAQDGLIFVGPFLLNAIITFLGSDDGVGVGIRWVVLMFVCSQIQSIILHQYFHRVFMVGMQLRAAITTTVFAKSLRISTSTKKDKSSGDIKTLMSVDAKRFQDLTPYLHMIWSSFVQIAVSLYFLWEQIDYAVLAGVAMMLIMFPLNGVIAKKMKAVQKDLMTIRGERTSIVTEVFNSIKTIKSYAWEKSFQDKIANIRVTEMRDLRRYLFYNVGQGSIWYAAPTFIALAAFGTYALLGNTLTPAKAFTTLALFNILRFPIGMLPNLVTLLAEAQVSVRRLEDFLAWPELLTLPTIRGHGPTTATRYGSTFEEKDGHNGHVVKSDSSLPSDLSDVTSGDSIILQDANYFWNDALTIPALRDLNLRLKKGSLTIVIGSTGAGKSAFLDALIGDLSGNRGQYLVQGSIAYTSQVPWIQNLTLRENILFGRDFHKDAYQRTLSTCALLPDLEILPLGDETEIGERGINLSGGQKHRVALARAVYQDADVYLLDDPLSAVDSHVARHIFDECIVGALKSKTVVLVTHAVNFLPQADMIVVLQDGKISKTGTHKELIAQGMDFATLVKQKQAPAPKAETPTLDVAPVVVSVPTPTVATKEEKQEMKVETKEKPAAPQKAAPAAPKGKDLTKEEERQVGSVSVEVYKSYIEYCGGWKMGLIMVVAFSLAMTSNLGTNLWLAYWAGKDDTSQTENNRDLGVYCALGLGDWLFTLVASLTMAFCGMSAAKVFHNDLLDSLLWAPMSFFDTTPIGRIINRFSKEIYVIDQNLGPSFSSYIRQCFGILGVVIVISYVTPFFLLALLPLSFLYYYIQKYYINSSRELKRLESVLQSPIYSHFAESLDGLATIRAFRCTDRFLKQNESRLDANLAAYYVSIAANRWLALRLEFVGVVLVTLAALFAVLSRSTISPELGGLSISYALSITGSLSWWVRTASDLETNIVSVERVLEFTKPKIPQEAPAIIVDNRPPANWPSKGVIGFHNLKMRYREGLDLVLKGVQAEIKAREKVGVVGRTGAGKSSVYLALLRLVEPAGGSITIDGIDIQNIGLEDLRSRISIIPQDPVCFSGTVRFNLDPFNKHTANDDKEIWEALEFAGLKAHILTMDGKLDAKLKEGGGNLSMGQRQLLCLARALLRKSAILLLDEATSAVDFKTDNMLQETIRTKFAGCTVLTIAHRLNTIMGSDRIFVLDEGRIVEQGPPDDLQKDPKTRFHALCQALEEH